MRALLILAVLALLAPIADAKPTPRRGRAKIAAKKPAKKSAASKPTAPKPIAARVAIGRSGELRPAREIIGRRDEPLTLEEQTAKEIAALLRGPLRNGVTGLFVADAKTGQPVFAVNADETLNPASNVKMIATATALDLLGPDFRYPTRLLGPAPKGGVVRGDVYLLGSYDPTLSTTDLDALAAAVAARGITAIEGDIIVGRDPTRDGIFRAQIPIAIQAGEPGKAPIATVPPGAEHVTVNVTATTSKRAHQPRLQYKVETTRSDADIPRITLTISGTIGKGRSTRHALWTRERTATAAYALRASLRAHAVALSGDLAYRDLGEFIGGAVDAGGLPIELGRHESRRLADIVARVNKWSVNWLADRVVMTAAALATRAPPSMDLALDAMYAWLERNASLDRKRVVLDTGSGLSYRTQISTTELVSVIRSAAGFASKVDPELSKAWLDSLAVARTDGTLRFRARNTDARARIRGKTGTLSTVIAVSGILDVDPDRPLVFSLVTNTDSPLSKQRVRLAHDKVMGMLCTYLAKSSRARPASAPPALAPVVEVAAEHDTDSEGDTELDAEAAATAP